MKNKPKNIERSIMQQIQIRTTEQIVKDRKKTNSKNYCRKFKQNRYEHY